MIDLILNLQRFADTAAMQAESPGLRIRLRNETISPPSEMFSDAPEIVSEWGETVSQRDTISPNCRLLRGNASPPLR